MKKKIDKQDETCPNCGYCNHCGQARPSTLPMAPIYPYYPWWVQPWEPITVHPFWSITPTVTTCDTATSSNVVLNVQ